MAALPNKKISTGIRSLLILDILTKHPASKEEIAEILSKGPIVQNVTKEMIKIDINTLKEAGFEILNLGKAEGYKYKIVNSPIKIKLKKEEVRLLTKIRKALFEIEDWIEILKLYELFEKISKFLSSEISEELMNFQYFLNVDFKILKELNAYANKKKTVLIVYNSPNSVVKEIPIRLESLKYKNSKLYITGISPNYPDTTVLRADKVKEIKRILKPFEKEPPARKTLYTILKADLENFSLFENEKIITETKKKIEVEIQGENDFCTVQRLLSFGENLISIKNEKIKETYKEELNKILESYEERKWQ